MPKRVAPQSGFSLIEVIVALAIMAAAASLLIGMQGAAISRTLRDRDAQQAMLAARRIMSSIEAAGDDAPLENFDGETVLETLKKFGGPDVTSDTEALGYASLRVAMAVDEIKLPIPNVEDDPMRKITLKVYWGTQLDEAFIITYLAPIQKTT